MPSVNESPEQNDPLRRELAESRIGNRDRGRKRLIDYGELRARVSIVQVLELIGWEPTYASGVQLRGPCPIHHSASSGSKIFSVNAERNIFRCFKCDAHGNQLDLWMQFTGSPIFDAAKDLCEKAHVDVPYRDA